MGVALTQWAYISPSELVLEKSVFFGVLENSVPGSCAVTSAAATNSIDRRGAEDARRVVHTEL